MIDDSVLVRYLDSLGDPVLLGRVAALSGALTDWLAYTTATFPHYTRHTAAHSAEIVSQLGKLLFRDDDPSQPTIELTAMECYLLVVAAYLHDAGMVASEADKQQILGSDEWVSWIGEQGAGRGRWEQMEAFRTGDSPADDALRRFIADRELRLLLADFVRRVHHLRANALLADNAPSCAISRSTIQRLRGIWETSVPATVLHARTWRTHFDSRI